MAFYSLRLVDSKRGCPQENNLVLLEMILNFPNILAIVQSPSGEYFYTTVYISRFLKQNPKQPIAYEFNPSLCYSQGLTSLGVNPIEHPMRNLGI